jgi:hypothetical protein
MAALYDIAPLEGRTRPDPKSVEYTDGIFRRVDRLPGRQVTSDPGVFVGCSLVSSVGLSRESTNLRKY